MARPVFYRVLESGVQAINADESRQMVSEISRETKLLAKASAPVRTTKLRNSINHNNAVPKGYLEMEGAVYANARHARWVLLGTEGPIRAKGGGYMKVPRRASRVRGAMMASSMTRPKKTVRGQRANNFLTRSLNRALAADGRTNVVFRAL